MDTIYELLIAFVLAATPWIELLVVIPLGLAWGLPPVPLAIVVFVGNTATVVPLIWLHERWHQWRRARRIRRKREERASMSFSPSQRNNDIDTPHTRRGARAQRLWNRYGLPGVALLAPLVTGVHLAAAICLLAGATRRAVFIWFTASILIWTVGMTIIAALGIEGVKWLAQ